MKRSELKELIKQTLQEETLNESFGTVVENAAQAVRTALRHASGKNKKKLEEAYNIIMEVYNNWKS